MDTLPVEILTDILDLVLQNSKPLNILCTSSLFYSIGQNILHQNLSFRSSSQLLRFAELISEKTLSLACEPQSIILDIAGGASYGIFEGLHAVLTEIVSDTRCKTDQNGRLVIETLKLRLNSLTHDDHRLIYTSLSRANPKNFIWTGPDPPHHFSTAIVAPAVFPLFTALSSYTRLTNLHLTNIAFPDPIVTPNSRWTGFPCIPSLRVLYLGQVTFLPAEHVAEFLLRCAESIGFTMASLLERVHLVDVYEESIWGPRLKMPHILAAGKTLLTRTSESDSGHSNESEFLDSAWLKLVDVIEKLVFVDAKTERIMGGDRARPELALT